MTNKRWSERGAVKDILDCLPERMRGGIIRYVEDGVPCGGFLTAVFTNDFYNAVNRADWANEHVLPFYGKLLTVMPSVSWGTRQRYNKWIERGGLNGRGKGGGQ